MHQPKNALAPWEMVTQNGGYVGIDESGLIAETVTVGRLVFRDGSSMLTAGSTSEIDSGTF